MALKFAYDIGSGTFQYSVQIFSNSRQTNFVNLKRQTIQLRQGKGICKQIEKAKGKNANEIVCPMLHTLFCF